MINLITYWDFRNNLWAPAYLIWHGGNPFNISALFPYCRAVWFPQAPGLFFFLGLMPFSLAANLWFLFSIALLAGLIIYLVRKTNGRVSFSTLLVPTLFVFLFAPTTRLLYLGQVGFLVIAVILGSIKMLTQRRLLFSGLLLSIALIKPQAGILIVPGMITWLVVEKRPKDIIILILATLFWGGVFTIPLWLSDLHWVTGFLSAMKNNPAWFQPNIFSIARFKLGAPGIAIWVLLFLVVLFWNTRTWQLKKPEQAVLWSLAMTPIISPYVWSWDFVLVLPLFLDTWIRSDNRARLFLILAFIITFVGSVVILTVGDGNDYILWWIPIVIMFGVIAAEKYTDKKGRELTQKT